MKVLIAASEAPEDFALRENKEKFGAYMEGWYAYSRALTEAGICLDGAALEPPSAATVVSVRNGKRTVEDGPFSDSKEQLGGFFILEVPDIATAAQWAAKCPAAKNGAVDARVIPDYGSGE